jgi:hypothetical protein
MLWDKSILLKWVLLNSDGEHGLDRSGSGYGQVAGSCEFGDKPSGFMKVGKFSD